MHPLNRRHRRRNRFMQPIRYAGPRPWLRSVSGLIFALLSGLAQTHRNASDQSRSSTPEPRAEPTTCVVHVTYAPNQGP